LSKPKRRVQVDKQMSVQHLFGSPPSNVAVKGMITLPASGLEPASTPFSFPVKRDSDLPRELSQSDGELRKMCIDSLLPRQDVCLYPKPCMYFYLYVSSTALHGRSWTKHMSRTGAFLQKGCTVYRPKHTFIIKECDKKMTHRLDDFAKA
jgi:hypothetical protein